MKLAEEAPTADTKADTSIVALGSSPWKPA